MQESIVNKKSQKGVKTEIQELHEESDQLIKFEMSLFETLLAADIFP